MNTPMPRTTLDKTWEQHIVAAESDAAPAVLYVDLHLVHEVTSPQAFAELRRRGLKVRSPGKTIATMDHSTPTTRRMSIRELSLVDDVAAAQLQQLATNCAEFGVPLYALGDDRQGIVHVIGPELGLTHPGMVIVCGDSHTSTHGAFGALAFGIGTTEVGHVLATQSLLQRKPKCMEVRIDGRLGKAVTAKDIILAVIREIGIDGGTGHVIEYTGSAVRALTMEERMTLCNMSIEGGARAGLVGPDDTTFQYVAGRTFAPTGEEWGAAVERWKLLRSDEGAVYSKSVHLDASAISPMVTFGTNPSMGIPVDGTVPDPAVIVDRRERESMQKALAYMNLRAGQKLTDCPIDVVFIGSCTNSRLSDLREAARYLRGRKVAPGLQMLVVPGSQEVKRRAEAEGLDTVFRHAGAEWREAGCSMCLAMNGDQLGPGQYSVSTSNRNFEGRQGRGGRTFLASPVTAAASAVAGHVADPRLHFVETHGPTI